MGRQRQIIRVSVVGIVANVLLVAFKALVGFFSGSIAIMMDALNILTDALSSVLTIIGTKLAGKAPDKKHPYGYGRIEYVTSITVACIVLVAGLSAFKESVDRIRNPEVSEFTAVSLIIVAVAVVAKYVLGRYVKAQGQKLNSESLVASGTEAFFDAIVSLSTLAAAAVALIFHVDIEGFLGVAISILIMKAGLEILVESLGCIIGNRVDGQLIENVKEKVTSFPEVHGVYDVVLHQYGPGKYMGSAHVEVDDTLTAGDIHRLTRRITEGVYLQYGIILTVGIYASNTDTPEAAQIKGDLVQIVSEYPEVLQMHGFYLDAEAKTVSFDLVLDFSAEHPDEVQLEILDKISSKYPTYSFYVILDMDF